MRQKQPSPRPVDVHVGSRLRLRRTMLGMSLEALGKRLGVTYQQVAKYQDGTNRIGASRLWELSNVLDVPVSFFFDDMPANVAETGGQRVAAGAVAAAAALDPMAKRETLELVRAYYRIRDAKVRKRVFELTKAVGRASDEEPVQPMADAAE